jgi:hypothetical protein
MRVRSYASSYRPPKPKQWTVRGWTGLYDSRADVQQPDEAALYLNLTPSDPVRGGPLYIRPGRETLGRAATAPQLTTDTQWIGEVTLTNGGQRTIAIASGEIYSVDTTAGTAPTKRITTANLTTDSITLSASAGCRCCVFDGKLIVSDATNVPFAWDGTANGGLTKLTNAPTGPLDCTVYYAKLFFLKADATTIVWSEELQVNTGYEAGGYNNAWELTQTSTDAIRAILGTNEGLYYGRTNSIGIIRGAVSSTFSNDGVHDSVHIGSGPLGPAVLVYGGGTLFWIDGKNQMMAAPVGGKVVNLTSQLPRRYGYESLSHASNATEAAPVYGIGEYTLNAAPNLITVDAVNQRLYVDASDVSGLGYRAVYVYDIASLRLLSIWSTDDDHQHRQISLPYRFTYACVAATTLASTDTIYVFVDESGYLFQHVVGSFSTLTPRSADYDELGAGTAITAVLMGPKHGDSHTTEWQFTNLDVVIDNLNSVLTTNYGYLTSRQHKVSLTPADQSTSNSLDNDPFEKRVAVGINANGRWLRPIITLVGHTGTTGRENPPQIFGYTLTGYPVSGTPNVT